MQATQYVESTGADIWISAEGSGGAFIGFSMLIEEYMAPLNLAPGLKPNSASPLVFAQARPIIRGKPSKAIVVGYRVGKLGGPIHVLEGKLFAEGEFDDYRPEAVPNLEVVVDEKMALGIGERIVIGGKELRVVGKAKSLMFVLDTPLLFMDIRTAQHVLLGDYPRVNMMIAKTAKNADGTVIARRLEEAFRIEVRTLQETIGDIVDYYVVSPMRAVTFLRVMLWLAAGILVGMITYVTTLEKTQEIGVLKAIGAPNIYVMGLILKQVVLMSVVGILCGLVLAFFSAAVAPISVSIHPIESLLVVVISCIVCCLSGYLAARRAISVDPMVAFRGEL